MAAIVQQTNEANPEVLQVLGVEQPGHQIRARQRKMDRKDAEVRMISARLPPYNNVVRRDGRRIEKLVSEEILRPPTI